MKILGLFSLLLLFIGFFDLKSALAKPPNTAKLIVQASEAFASRDYTFALGLYKKILALDASDPQTQFSLGCTYIALNDFLRASEHLKNAIELNPALIEGYFALAYAYQALGKKDEALVFYRRGLGLDLNKPLPRNTLFSEVVLNPSPAE